MASSDLTPLEDALTHLLSRAPSLIGTETVALIEALDRILAQDQLVPADVPPADNSSVDGYAVHQADLAQGQTIPVSARIPAGTAPTPLAEGSAARIFTGSEIPAGADAVVMQEQVEVSDAGIRVGTEVTPGQNIRRRGQDLKQGDLALPAGTRLRPQELGLLASMGVARVPVKNRLKVAILTTGDELVEVRQRPGEGQIREGNTLYLRGACERLGCEVLRSGIVRDDAAALELAFRQALADSDALITTGGVSMGKYDLVGQALEAAGVVPVLHKVAIKPGKIDRSPTGTAVSAQSARVTTSASTATARPGSDGSRSSVRNMSATVAPSVKVRSAPFTVTRMLAAPRSGAGRGSRCPQARAARAPLLPPCKERMGSAADPHCTARA